MVKVYKKNDKNAIYLPYEVVQQLGIRENDEVDFFRFNDKSFLFAKKEDVANLLTGQSAQMKKEGQAQAKKDSGYAIASEEIVVLKKLDTLRYPARTITNVDKILSADEKKVLDSLMKKGAVTLFNDEKRKEKLYSISKSIYDNFLMRKLKQEAVTTRTTVIPKVAEAGEVPAPAAKIAMRPNIENESITSLEKNGYVVLQTEAEASAISLALEASIRQGAVLGTRAFNKKYYIVMRTFFDKNSGKIIKELRGGPKKIEELAKAVTIDEDGARGILYLLSESGDTTENRKDIFALVE